MQITQTLTRRILAVLGVTAVTLAAAAPASASDAGLRKVIAQQEKRIAPAAEEFSEAVKTPTSAVGIERLTAAIEDLSAGTSSYRKAVTKVKTTTPKVRRGRADLVLALASVTDALETYQEGLQLVLDEKLNEAKARFKRAAAERKSANTKVNRALSQIAAPR